MRPSTRLNRPSTRFDKKLRAAMTFLLALLLAVVVLPGAALANPPGPVPDGNNNNNQQNPSPPPGGSNNNNQQNPSPPPGGGNTPLNPPTPTPTPPPSTTADSDSEAHPDAPDFPSADCIVMHAATPAQLCPVAGGLQYYFIGADGSSQTGPYIRPFSELATLHTSGTSVRLYSGSNPFTGKSVTIAYLPTDSKLRISTYYPDTQYDTDKPYTFTVSSGHSVTHEAW